MGDTACTLHHDLIVDFPRESESQTEVTVIVPVYNAPEDLERLIERLEAVSHPLIFINDGSTDPRIAPILDRFVAKHPKSVLIKHAQNEGFVAAVNAGMAQAKGHVVILNTDTLPPANWLNRLIAPILDDPSIASVTPFSNNAEILSVPNAGVQTAIDERLVDRIDQAAQHISLAYDIIELPTGIGFCMAMNRRFIEQLPRFDDTFGRGYGEEVDWCRKTQALGGRHVALASLFVGHKGGASFRGEKTARIKRSSEIIRQRYPDYDIEVQNWVHNAPAKAQTIALSVAWLSVVSESPVPVYLAHSMGGGAETALSETIQCQFDSGALGIIVLRVGGPARWRLELVTPEWTHIGDAMESETIQALLRPIKKRRLIYSCGVGGRHPMDAPQMLERLFTSQSELEIHIHDFFPISPSWNLLNSRGCFEGVPEIGACDAAHSIPALDGKPPIPHSTWRDVWKGLFARATNVIAFSNSSRDLIANAYPEAAAKITIVPHQLQGLPGQVAEGGKTIGVLGSLNRPKGGEVIQNIGRCTARRIVVLGEMDGQFKLADPHIVHGPYAHERIAELASSYDIGLWVIPSICPETFSFATHEALATGLPVLAFDRGAQGEAVSAAPNGHVLSIDSKETSKISEEIERVFANQHQ
jgi:GT2 family glycosyltransferase